MHKIWVDGQKLDVTIARDNLEEGFGFGVASKFRIEGYATVRCLQHVALPCTPPNEREGGREGGREGKGEGRKKEAERQRE